MKLASPALLLLSAILLPCLAACQSDDVRKTATLAVAPLTPAPPVAPDAPDAPVATDAPVAVDAPVAPDAPVGTVLTSTYSDVVSGEGRFAYQEAVLSNGLRVISLEDHSTPIVAVQLWYHVGAKDEDPQRRGFAHLFEHMMFRGTDRLGPKDHFEYIKRTGGDANAYTAFDQTVYVQELPKQQLEMVLWLEAERMSSLKIDEGGFATERKVVEEERRMGLNAPYGDVAEKVLDEIFELHPYQWSPIGNIEHLRAATVQEIQNFWDTFYVPNNATLVVVGDVTHAQVRELAKQSFGWIPRCAEPPRVTIVEPEQTAARSVTITPENGPVPIAGVVIKTVPAGHPDTLALNMTMQILGGGESSRLYLELVRRQDLAEVGLGAHVSFEQAGLALAGGILLNPFGDTDAIIDAVWEQIDLLIAEGVTADELDKVRQQMYRSDVTESLTIASKANALGNAAVILGDTQLANSFLDRVLAVTPEDIQRVAREHLVREHSTAMTIKPTLMSGLKTLMALGGGGEDDGEKAADEAEDIADGARGRAGGPKASAVRPRGLGDLPPVAPALATAIDLASVERTLPNGLRVVVIENHEVPFVSASLRLRPGSYTEDQTQPGSAAMAAAMVTRGTLLRDAEAMAAELEAHGISLNASVNHDGGAVSMSSVRGEFERTLQLMSEVVQVPAFDEQEFNTLRSQMMFGLAISEKDPSSIADRRFTEELWGDHPYAHPAAGSSEDLAALEIEPLADWWAERVRPESAVLYVAGDVTPEEVWALAEESLGTWEVPGDVQDITVAAAEPTTGTRIVLVDKPGAIQSQIRVGHDGIDRNHPLHPASVVIGQVLGGGFNSRLNDVIRVQRGLTYGAGGGFSPGRFGGTFRVRTFTKTPTTGETVQAVLDVINDLRDNPPAGDELRDASAYLAGSFAGSLETPQAVAGRLWTQELLDLPGDYWSRYLEGVTSISDEQAAAAALELVDTDRLLIVVVGDAAKVQEQLEAIAEVEVITGE